ncbi:hypothetical protein [Sphingobium subterraneum]|uniref:Uncharacterized protein n=1 Tax=Sphingobium subterraneum TaxID=627688 RepID=A0A841J147_9SPHN|nr:hypothetical protein [Sphingobium subterraneum]MBB6123246.1 hypothetical protein [Sphingobium subterraneum]
MTTPADTPAETVVDLGGGFLQITRMDVEERDDLSEAEPDDQ